MRKPLGVVAGLVTAAALCVPVTAAAATAAITAAATDTSTVTASQAACRLSVTRPFVTAGRRLKATAVRTGCGRTALVRIRIKRAVPGADPVVKSAATKGRSTQVTATLKCLPGVYYAVVTDYRGTVRTSKPTRLSCRPTPAPATPADTPTATPTPTTTATTAPPPSSTGTADENEVVRLTNAERAKGSCGPLKMDAQLRKAAFGHSSDMAAQNYFDHTSKDGRSFLDRIRGAGFTGGNAWAENIAMGQPSAASVVTAWMNSPGHKANIMNCKYNLIGVGAAKNSKGQIYWTQDFAAR